MHESSNYDYQRKNRLRERGERKPAGRNIVELVQRTSTARARDRGALPPPALKLQRGLIGTLVYGTPSAFLVRRHTSSSFHVDQQDLIGLLAVSVSEPQALLDRKCRNNGEFRTFRVLPLCAVGELILVTQTFIVCVCN